jgi:hypothetical protein
LPAGERSSINSLTTVRPYKIDPPKGGKEKKKEKIGNEGKKGKKEKKGYKVLPAPHTTRKPLPLLR